MSYAAIDAGRVAKAANSALKTLASIKERTEAHERKILMIERIAALADAAAQTKESGLITLTSEEFWLISKNW